MLVRLDTLQLWRGEALGGLRHPLNIEDLWSVDQLAAVGLVKRIPFTLPNGQQTVGAPTYDATGQETYATEPIPPPSAAENDANKEAELTNSVETLAFKVLFDHENRVRALEGKAPINAATFRTALKNRL